MSESKYRAGTAAEAQRQVFDRESARLAIVGLGDQGMPIAANLLKDGWSLAFFARRDDVAGKMIDRGARQLSRLEDLGVGSDVVHVVVVDDEQVREVVLNESGFLRNMSAGSVIVIHSTVSPRLCHEIAAAAAVQEVQVVDAPVSGGRERSWAARLTVMVGGDAPTVRRLEPILSAFASSVLYMGALGTGMYTKLINNYMFVAHSATATTAEQLCRIFELDLDRAGRALSEGTGASEIFRLRSAANFNRPGHPKGPTFASEVLAKDVELLRAAVKERNGRLDATDEFIEITIAELLQPAPSHLTPDLGLL
jgi:3-hydroxyisobutyrate dehydrogenase